MQYYLPIETSIHTRRLEISFYLKIANFPLRRHEVCSYSITTNFVFPRHEIFSEFSN